MLGVRDTVEPRLALAVWRDAIEASEAVELRL